MQDFDLPVYSWYSEGIFSLSEPIFHALLIACRALSGKCLKYQILIVLQLKATQKTCNTKPNVRNGIVRIECDSRARAAYTVEQATVSEQASKHMLIAPQFISTSNPPFPTTATAVCLSKLSLIHWQLAYAALFEQLILLYLTQTPVLRSLLRSDSRST